MIKLGSLTIDETGKKAQISAQDGSILNLFIGESLSSKATKIHGDEKTIHVDFEDDTKVKIELKKVENWIDVYKFCWKKPKNLHYLKDTIELGDTPWYGGALVCQYAWPIDKNGYKFLPYVIMDVWIEHVSGQERYWLSSKKMAVYVPTNIPLWTQIQNGYLGLQAQMEDSPYQGFPPPPEDQYLEYEIWVCTDERPLADFHMECSKHLLGKPNGYPDPLLIEKPIWTTWAKYGKGVHQQQVLDFGTKIIEHNFEISQLELDDMWTTKYGDNEIDPRKFPDFEGMIEKLKSMNIRLTAWVHPFINLDSKNGKDESLRKFFVHLEDGQPGVINWWNGQAYMLDMTNPEAVKWFRDELEGLQKKGIYSFKFDAGEVHYLPKNFKLHSGTEPNDFSRGYARFAASFGGAVEARVASRTQELPIFLRTLDRASKWVDAGLQTLIPGALILSLHGYFWNLPDIIGGNGYGNFEEDEINNLPEDKELYIRWVQANTFLLTMQFSFCPWEFDEETINLVRDLLKLREKWVPYMKAECEKAIQIGVPVIRSLWWHLESHEAFTCSDQFFVGEKLLIAPVLTQGAKSRDVILPEGKWRDHKGTIIVGPNKITVDTPLDVLPFYEKISAEDDSYCSVL